MFKILEMFEKAKMQLNDALRDNNDAVAKQAALTLEKLEKKGLVQWLSD